MPNRIIFLDYDGVVNNYLWSNYLDEETGEKYLKCSYAFPKDDIVNNFQAICWLNALYDEYPYEIVVTSTWRHYDNYKDCLYNAGLNKNIKISKTNDVHWSRRDEEVYKWILDNNFNGSFVILDDDSSLYNNLLAPSLKSNFILVNKEIGINEKIIGEMVKLFKRQENDTSYTGWLDDFIDI